MGVVIPHKAIEAISTSDYPKTTIQELAGDLDDIELIGDRVLIGIYMRPEKTSGGIIRPTANKEEDVWQGKVGLVLKWGPDAFRDPETGDYYEQRVEVGEWGVFFIGDGKPIQINQMPCRIVRDSSFVAKIKNPMSIL
jgi:co-chaperonin GroES (HSP10)